MGYDNGSVFSAKVLDVTEDVLVAKFTDALSRVASLSLALGYPTQASIPHSIANAFKMLLLVVKTTLSRKQLLTGSCLELERRRSLLLKKPLRKKQLLRPQLLPITRLSHIAHFCNLVFFCFCLGIKV